ncbi:hypothetical protein V6Z11_A10G176900 [Gossypium hirsutum]
MKKSFPINLAGYSQSLLLFCFFFNHLFRQTGLLATHLFQRIDVNALRKGRNLPGNKGRLSNSNNNVFCRALTVDSTKKSADFCPEKSLVSTLQARQNKVRKYWMSGHFYKGGH